MSENLKNLIASNVTLLGSQLSDFDKLNNDNIEKYVEDHVSLFVDGGSLNKLAFYTTEIMKERF